VKIRISDLSKLFLLNAPNLCLQENIPCLRKFANCVTDVNMMLARERREGCLSGTAVRNQFYYELMRLPPHYRPGSKNHPAPLWVQEGCAAAFPWGKRGYEDHPNMPDDHEQAYAEPHGLSDADVHQIMDLILANFSPLTN
jgi:hypothetical protein